MAYQMTFKRYELKYLLTRQQKEQILQEMSSYMKLDDYGRTTIRNIYFDTDNFRLIRHSLEKPVYKEKLRIRSYPAGLYKRSGLCRNQEKIQIGSLQKKASASRGRSDGKF